MRREEGDPVVRPMVGVPGCHAFEVAERRRQVQAAILALTPEHREVIVLRHFADLSYDEIAETLGIGAGTVKSRLYAARQQLCDRLAPWDSRH